jgi:antitoxin component YwqK of YwqJK toxin-antitoxin module
MYKKIISLITFSLLVSCGNKEIKLSDLVDRGNVFYKINSEKPFTGKFISYYEEDYFAQEKIKIESEGFFKDGKLDGELVKYFPIVKEYNF